MKHTVLYDSVCQLSKSTTSCVHKCFYAEQPSYCNPYPSYPVHILVPPFNMLNCIPGSVANRQMVKCIITELLAKGKDLYATHHTTQIIK